MSRELCILLMVVGLLEDGTGELCVLPRRTVRGCNASTFSALRLVTAFFSSFFPSDKEGRLQRSRFVDFTGV
jgi:hypothetical protein